MYETSSTSIFKWKSLSSNAPPSNFMLKAEMFQNNPANPFHFGTGEQPFHFDNPSLMPTKFFGEDGLF